MTETLLSLGTNMGNRQENLREAIRRLSVEVGLVTSVSSVYETKPWGFNCATDFLNIAVRIETTQNAVDVLKKALLIEETMGRVRGTDVGYASRIIDIDILFYSDAIISTPKLEIPHPHIASRQFVLQPLTEIAPDFIHPVLQKPIHQLLLECTDETEILKLGPL